MDNCFETLEHEYWSAIGDATIDQLPPAAVEPFKAWVWEHRDSVRAIYEASDAWRTELVRFFLNTYGSNP